MVYDGDDMMYPTFFFEGEGRLYVYPKCLTCGRFLKLESAAVNGLGEVRIEGSCSCGDPKYEYGWI